MAFRIQLRRDTASKWTINNPVLLLGEPGIEIDTHKIKIGDGVLSWNSLPYLATQGPTGPSQPEYTGSFIAELGFTGGDLSSVTSSKGPDGTALTGPNWNFSFDTTTNTNFLVVTHNTGRVITSLNLQGLTLAPATGGRLVGYNIISPTGTDNGSLYLTASQDMNSFTVGNLTGDVISALSGSGRIVWTFGGTV